MAVSPLLRRLEKLEQERRGGGLWIMTAYDADPEKERKIKAATDRAIAEKGASPNDLFVAVVSMISLEGNFPPNYSANRIRAAN